MPFKSDAQRRKFYYLKSVGKMDQKTIDEWEKDTPKNIPERIHKKEAVYKLGSAAAKNMIGKGILGGVLGGGAGYLAGPESNKQNAALLGMLAGSSLGIGKGLAYQALLNRGSRMSKILETPPAATKDYLTAALLNVTPLATLGGATAGALTKERKRGYGEDFIKRLKERLGQ